MTAAVTDLDPFAILDAEADRLDRFLDTLHGQEWDAPSRAQGWSVRDVLAHLAGEESYNHACLDDEVSGFLSSLGESGVSDVDGFNAWSVEQRRGLPVADVLAEWRAASSRTRQRMRALGRDAQLATMAGPYPAGLQALHFASEFATHADDVHVPTTGQEEPSRTDWRVRVGRFALSEKDGAPAVEVSEPDGRVIVEVPGEAARLSPAEFVEATVGRLPDDHPLDSRLRAALRCLA